MRTQIVSTPRPPDPRTPVKHTGVWFIRTIIEQHGGRQS